MSTANLRQHRSIALILLVFLLAIAFTLRFWHNGTLPGGLYPDESVNGIDAIHALETHSFQLFYQNNNGREGLFINLQALALAIFGFHTWALRLWSALFGTLAVLGVYLVALELWRRKSLALVSAFLFTFSYWAINFSRIGFRAIMVPFILTFSIYFLLRGLRTLRLWSFFWSGIIFGLGLHTYIAFRLAPLILVIFFIGAILAYQDFLKRFWKHILIFILGAFITALPMFYDFAKNPDHFVSRSNSISVFSPDINHGNLPLTLGETFGLSLLKYNFWGDQNWRHNYPPYPNLDPFTGTLFLLGFIFLFSRIFILLRRRFKDHAYNPELARLFLILGWFFVMLMPEFLTNEGLPHSLRAIGTLPVVFLIAVLPLMWLREWYRIARPTPRLGFIWICVIFLMLVASWNTIKYFYFFANNPNQHGAFNQNYTNMADYLISLPSDVHKYVYTNAGGTMIDDASLVNIPSLPVTAQPLVFLTHGAVSNLTYIMPDTDFTLTAPAVIIPMNYDGSFIEKLHTNYPNLRTEKIDLKPGTQSDFTAILIQ
ncbi:MAG: glycosyltransferase family 39 protein [Candidatus Moraniibacteriota bacterium]